MNNVYFQRSAARSWFLGTLVCLLVLVSASPAQATFEQAPAVSIPILLDDFKPQPDQGVSEYPYNRLNGNRGGLNNSLIDWGTGHVRVTIGVGNTWGGIWESLNHPIIEGNTVNFSAILPDEILPEYQSQITGLAVQIVEGTPGAAFRLELKDKNNLLQWSEEVTLTGGAQSLSYGLPALGEIAQLVLVLDQSAPGDYVVIERLSFTATVPARLVDDPAAAAFVWSYGMLLNNWNPDTGLVRDKAKDASGEFDAIQATGSLAAATALAKQQGVISQVDAVRIVNSIEQVLLGRDSENNYYIPRLHGLWPHFVKQDDSGKFVIVPCFDIAQCTEWSSIDTVIAAVGLLTAQGALGLDTSATEQMLKEIDWQDLTDLDDSPLTPPDAISHGYAASENLLTTTWDTFGGESWLVALAHASVTDQIAPIPYPSPPTADGSGFIDELAWLYVLPPSAPDHWNTSWHNYRLNAADTQLAYFSTNYPASCVNQFGLYGLSAAEVPDPSRVAMNYQAFGVGGQFSDPNDNLAGLPVVVPHYSAMTASLRPQAALNMWAWLIANGYFSPLNNVESLMFDPADADCNSSAVFNDLKGSWNLALQTLGWGIFLAHRDIQLPSLWLANTQNPFLRQGYSLLVSEPGFFVSAGAHDGWLLELAEPQNIGGTLNKTASQLRVGDDSANKQYRAILSFDTAFLPEDAQILSVTLMFKHVGVSGINPFNTHGKLLADICEGAFKNNPALQLGDFNARCPAGFYKAKALIYSNTNKVGGWYSQSLLPEDFQFINLGGVTQFRLRFARDDNNDFGADFLKLHSGNALNEADRPQLIIEYYVP